MFYRNNHYRNSGYDSAKVQIILKRNKSAIEFVLVMI